MIGRLLITGAGIAIKGVGKALKAYKRKAKRKKLGLPAIKLIIITPTKE